jgi:hypothetical protein
MIVRLRNGVEFRCSPEDYGWITRLPLAACGARGRRYIVSWSRRRLTYLHLLVMPKPAGSRLYVDHIDRDPMHCCRANLRLCTNRQNVFNSGPGRNNTSGYKGVSWHRRVQLWSASIWVGEKNRHLGYFRTPEEAARAYNEAAARVCPGFAYLNPLTDYDTCRPAEAAEGS